MSTHHEVNVIHIINRCNIMNEATKKLTKIMSLNWFELQNHTLSFKNGIYFNTGFSQVKD